MRKKLFDFKSLNEGKETLDLKIEKRRGQEIKSNKDIAIIGMSGKFPGADNIEQFWDKIIDKQDCVREFSRTRQKDIEAFLAALQEEGYEYSAGAYLDEIDKFDYRFFRLSPREANLMDPHQRLFLETAWATLEDGGYGGKKLIGSRTGVFVGYRGDEPNDYKKMISQLDSSSGSIAVSGNLTSILASRISYLLDFKGPSFTIDSACSSSLVAVHLACQSIRTGDCDQAIAGSVKVKMIPTSNIKLGIESSDGRARSFDDDSNGTSVGEGVGAILLKPLSNALRDGDHVYAVIKGSAVNQDGASIGITAPNALAQEDVIMRAWKDAGIDPETISYIEAHGTGTQLGDPIEIDGISRAFRNYTQKLQFCAIGSVKTNIGHLDNAAGIAGLIKCVMALKHRKIPPLIHFKRPNRKINFLESPLYVADKLQDWEVENKPRRCGISSFGLSGTNCHIILEESPTLQMELQQNTERIQVFTLSAKSKKALMQLIRNYSRYLYNHSEVDIADLCYTTNTGRGHYSYRLAILCEDVESLTLKLEEISLDGLEAQIQDVFYGEHKVITGFQADNDGNVMTEKDVREYSQQAKKIIDEMSSIDSLDRYLLISICNFYVNGAEIEWDHIYKYGSYRKLSLPTYPFERTRCWLEASVGEQPARIQNHKERATKTIRIKLKGREKDNYTLTEEAIAQVWCEVLGFREIDIFEEFYQLGGDSLHATRIVNLLNKKFGSQIDIASLLKKPTIHKFASYFDQVNKLVDGQKQTSESDQSVEETEYYPVTSAQKRLYTIQQVNPDSTAYHLPHAFMIEGKLNRERLERAFRIVIGRHEVLRTYFDIQDGEIVQKIEPRIEFNIPEVQLVEDEVCSFIEKFFQPMNLCQAPLMRVCIVSLSEEKNLLLFDIHHIITDGTSMGIMIKELMEVYRGKDLSDILLQYKDFSIIQKNALTSKRVKEQEEYWTGIFQGNPPVLNLPTDIPRPHMRNLQGDTLNFILDSDLTNNLQDLANKNSSTLFMVLLAIYSILLKKYSGQEDIVIGSPIAGRSHADLQNVMGMFTNTLPLRTNPVGNKTFKQFLEEVKKNVLNAYQNQEYQMDDLLQKIDVTHDLSRNPLFDTMFILQNMDIPDFNFEGLKISQYPLKGRFAKFDLSLEARNIQGALACQLEYSTELFYRSTMERLAGHFTQLAELITKNPEMHIDELEMMTPMEKMMMLNYSNINSITENQNVTTIPALFEKQVEKTPNYIAVSFGNEQVTYQELNERANRIAHVLRRRGVKADSIVGLMVDRSIEMITGILGILKAGGAYLPIDPKYPQDRIKYLLRDSSAKVLLTQDPYSEYVEFQGEVIDIYGAEIVHCDASNPVLINKPTNLAYVIYTSGTTGNPKGVLIEHRSILNYSLEKIKICDYKTEDVTLQLLSVSFDAFGANFYPTILSGATLVILGEEDSHNFSDIPSIIHDKRITNMGIVPSMLREILHHARVEDLQFLKFIVLGGERADKELFHLIQSLAPHVLLINEYGPTENSIGSTIFKGMEEKTASVIGYPLPGTQIQVLDSYGSMLPIGIPGEICVSGNGLARGYLNRPELTAEKFIEKSKGKEGRIYCTGDIGRWREDGTIEYIGRSDDQVKIRGFRIELSEIEAKLIEIEAIKEAVVLVREEQDVQVLVAYLVSSRNWSVIELREELSQKLPAYMIPSYFAQIESLPLTANGKVDKYSLESNPYLTSKQDYVSPSNQSEVLISRVVEEVLGIEKLGMYDNFFELGASSLEIMKIAAKLSLHFELSVNDIYKYPTVNCLAKKIRYTTNHLRQQIEEAKKQFVTKAEQWKLPLVMDERINSYEEHCQKYRKIDLHEAHHYQNILLCGVTGFLGIHLLRELLINTKAIVYLFVRGNTVEEARQRLRDKLRFYHMEEIYFQNINRVKLFNGDISKESFGLTEFDYKFLCEKIDAILNSAANVKHYGVFDSFNRPNVIGTKNLIEFAETDKSKHLHLISTISVASGSIEDVNQCLFTEYDCDVNQQTDSYYIQTKMEAEKLVIEARSRGIITNIYRVGNLVFQSDTGIFQENISENSFYTLIKSLVSLGIIPAIELENLDFTFINEVSGAIIKLMDIKSLVNETHHLVNPYRISLKELFGYIQEIEGQTQCTSPVQFLDFLLECLENNKYGTEIENLLFHSNLLERPDQTIFVVKNGKTDLLLRRLGHLWSKVTVSHIDKMLKHCKEVNFIG